MFIRRFLWWCAGSDNQVLIDCPNSDQIKHAGFGTLVLVPAVLALVSMSYAVSTLTKDPRKAWSIAVLWAMVVFVIDRFIVSNFRKSDKPSKDLLSLTFLSRVTLAALVGLIIAHPLVMFIFNESITSRLDEKQQLEIQAINASFDSQLGPYVEKKHKLNDTIVGLHGETDKRISEHAAALPVSMSPRRSRWRIAELRRTRDRLISERNTNIKRYESEQTGLDTTTAELERERKRRLQEYKQARDYVGREMALSDLVNANGIVRWTQRLLIMLFVLVDILPITFKGMTKKESYDFLVEDAHKRVADGVKQEEVMRVSLLDATKGYQEERIEEILRARRRDPNANTILIRDIDKVLKRSLLAEVRPATTDEDSIRAPLRHSSRVSPLAVKDPWYGRVKKKAADKSLDLIVGVACIPLEALVAFAWFVFTGKDVLRYVSFNTLLQVFPLFVMNFAVSGLFKRTTHLSE